VSRCLCVETHLLKSTDLSPKAILKLKGNSSDYVTNRLIKFSKQNFAGYSEVEKTGSNVIKALFERKDRHEVISALLKFAKTHLKESTGLSVQVIEGLKAMRSPEITAKLIEFAKENYASYSEIQNTGSNVIKALFLRIDEPEVLPTLLNLAKIHLKESTDLSSQILLGLKEMRSPEITKSLLEFAKENFASYSEIQNTGSNVIKALFKRIDEPKVLSALLNIAKIHLKESTGLSSQVLLGLRGMRSKEITKKLREFGKENFASYSEIQDTGSKVISALFERKDEEEVFSTLISIAKNHLKESTNLTSQIIEGLKEIRSKESTATLIEFADENYASYEKIEKTGSNIISALLERTDEPGVLQALLKIANTHIKESSHLSSQVLEGLKGIRSEEINDSLIKFANENYASYEKIEKTGSNVIKALLERTNDPRVVSSLFKMAETHLIERTGLSSQIIIGIQEKKPPEGFTAFLINSAEKDYSSYKEIRKTGNDITSALFKRIDEPGVILALLKFSENHLLERNNQSSGVLFQLQKKSSPEITKYLVKFADKNYSDYKEQRHTGGIIIKALHDRIGQPGVKEALLNIAETHLLDRNDLSSKVIVGLKGDNSSEITKFLIRFAKSDFSDYSEMEDTGRNVTNALFERIDQPGVIEALLNIAETHLLHRNSLSSNILARLQENN